MAREKGTGSLQREKSGRWTIRVGINGKRYSRSTRTTDRAKAEAMLDRFLAPFGLGSRRLPLAEVWHHYEMSPQRKDIAKSTLNTKRVAWMHFAKWIETNHVEITHLADVTDIAIAEYLAEYRCHHSASTYNGHVCTLREVFRLLAEKAGLVDDPWYGVCLLTDDSLSRRELTIKEVEQLYMQAEKQGPEWKLLVMTGIYTGLRLGDCCHLKWESVNLERGIIQVIPEKTKKHAHGRPVTIPIHPELQAALEQQKERLARKPVEVAPTPPVETAESSEEPEAPSEEVQTPPEEVQKEVQKNEQIPPEGDMITKSPPSSMWSVYVNPKVAEDHIMTRWKIDEGLRKIFNAAGITMSVHVEGRQRKHVLASFHSLRHTFVSISANAGVPLAVVQSIVGHCSSAMTRHYYHENEDALRAAVAAIPAIGCGGRAAGAGTRYVAPQEGSGAPVRAVASGQSVTRRIKRLDRMFGKGLITEAEYAANRQRILAEL